MDYKQIKDSLLVLRENDPDYKEFGASYHKYTFNAVLSLSQIESFENTQKVLLPEDYKGFLLNVGDGGAGPYYGLRSLNDSMLDFKLKEKPLIAIEKPFPYSGKWNEQWIENFDWENELPDDDVVKEYMDVKHIQGCLEICHYGHGCTFLLVLTGNQRGNIWFDGRADYGGIEPELNKQGEQISFFEWYTNWLENKLSKVL